ncbi:MAG: LAGLIDADG family homing endonuclease [Candidatus Methanomethylicaceae archaeon]
MKLTKDWIVGFVDGEGCFHVSINQKKDLKNGFQVLPEFVIVQHKRDIKVLYAIKKFFGFGIVKKNHDDRWCYVVRKLEHLEKICDFFTKNPLKTIKNVNFIKFRKVINKIKRKDHLTVDGLVEIIDIVNSMNTQKREKLIELKKQLLCGEERGPGAKDKI